MKSGPHVQRLWRVITELGLDATSEEFAFYRFLIEHGMLDDRMARNILLTKDAEIRYAMDHPNPLHRPPTQEELHPSGPPDIRLGHLVHAPDVEFGLRILDRPRNVLIGGNAGAGKTTDIAKSIAEVDRLNQRDPDNHICLIILDKLGSYWPWVQAWGDKSVHLNVHNRGTRVSLAAPDGVPAKVWCNLVASIFCALAGLLYAWTCLSSMMQWLVGMMNAAADTLVRWPSLRLLLELAKAVPLSTWAAKPEYEKSLINQLEAAVQSTDVFDCLGGGLDLEYIIRARKHLLLEMPNMAPAWVRLFMMSILFAQVLYGRIHRGQKTNRTEVIFVLDEFDQDATAAVDRLFPDGMSPLAQMLRLGRQYGIMCIIGMGRLQHASPYVLSEAQYHLIFNQSDAASMAMARATLALPPIADAMFAGLKPGFCVAREAQGPWEHPMLVKIDYEPPPPAQPITEYDTLPVIPAKSLDELPEVQASIKELVADTHKAELHRARTLGPTLSKHAHQLLHAAAMNPWAPAATLWKLTGEVPSPAVQKAVRKKLKAAGYADSVETRLGSANVLLYRTTSEGWAFLGLAPPKNMGRGQIAHQHISHWIARGCEMDGHKASCESVVPGTSDHPVDCSAEIAPGVLDIYEVIVEATHNIVDHLTKLSPCPKVRTITIVCLQKQEIHRLQKVLAKEPVVQALGDRLRWELAETFLRRCFP